MFVFLTWSCLAAFNIFYQNYSEYSSKKLSMVICMYIPLFLGDKIYKWKTNICMRLDQRRYINICLKNTWVVIYFLQIWQWPLILIYYVYEVMVVQYCFIVVFYMLGYFILCWVFIIYIWFILFAISSRLFNALLACSLRFFIICVLYNLVNAVYHKSNKLI